MTESKPRTWADVKGGSVDTLAIHMRGAAAWAERDDYSDVEAVVMLSQIARAEEALRDARIEVVRLERNAGRTWAEVGELLGITRQAAQQRFGELTL